MAFFLIVPSVMTVSVLLIHALANRLGLRIYYTTLVAVAVVSIMVNIAATFVTPAIGREYLLHLGLMILAAAFLLTLANRFLLKKELAEEKRFQEVVKAAYEAEKKKDLEFAQEDSSPLQKFRREDEDDVIDLTPAYNKTSSKVEEVPVDKEIPSEVEEVSADKEVPPEVEETPANKEIPSKIEEISVDKKVLSEVEETPVDKKSPPEVEVAPVDNENSEKVDEELKENPSLPEDFPLEEVFQPLPEVKPEEADKPIKLAEKPSEESFPLEEVFQPLSEVKPEEVKHFDTPQEKNLERTELFPLQEVFRPLSTLNLNKLEEITQEEKNLPHEEETTHEEKIDTLDDLLDKAYAERDKGNIWQAIETYKKALERYRNDEYAPFVAIDLGNIYKDQALYSKAIKTYEEALKLPAVERNPSTQKEFTTNLEYLRVVHKVLVRHHALSTPFNKISKGILQEIDAEFKKVQINSAQ